MLPTRLALGAREYKTRGSRTRARRLLEKCVLSDRSSTVQIRSQNGVGQVMGLWVVFFVGPLGSRMCSGRIVEGGWLEWGERVQRRTERDMDVKKNLGNLLSLVLLTEHL